jgi:hypothetical protein
MLLLLSNAAVGASVVDAVVLPCSCRQLGTATAWPVLPWKRSARCGGNRGTECRSSEQDARRARMRTRNRQAFVYEKKTVSDL